MRPPRPHESQREHFLLGVFLVIMVICSLGFGVPTGIVTGDYVKGMVAGIIGMAISGVPGFAFLSRQFRRPA